MINKITRQSLMQDKLLSLYLLWFTFHCHCLHNNGKSHQAYDIISTYVLHLFLSLTNFTKLVNVSFASICDEKSAYGRLMNLLSTLEQIKSRSVSPVKNRYWDYAFVIKLLTSFSSIIARLINRFFEQNILQITL